MLVVQTTIGLPELVPDDADQALDNQVRFVLIGTAIVVVGVDRRLAHGRTVFRFQPDDPRIRSYLTRSDGASPRSFSCSRSCALLFGPTGYFSTVDG